MCAKENISKFLSRCRCFLKCELFRRLMEVTLFPLSLAARGGGHWVIGSERAFPHLFLSPPKTGEGGRECRSTSPSASSPLMAPPAGGVPPIQRGPFLSLFCRQPKQAFFLRAGDLGKYPLPAPPPPDPTRRRGSSDSGTTPTPTTSCTPATGSASLAPGTRCVGAHGPWVSPKPQQHTIILCCGPQ